MKALMYHYVRPVPEDLPYFRYLHKDNFEKQLDWLAENFGFVRKEDFENAIKGGPVPSGVVLTFDDGLKDHYEHVFTMLQRKNLWGLFYITTGIYRQRELLDVHKVHYILGLIGGAQACKMLREILSPEMLVDQDIQKFNGRTYHFQDNDRLTKEFKHCLNYEIDVDYRPSVLNTILGQLGVDKEALFDSYYMRPEEIAIMHDAGMHIGSHTETHTVLSKLTASQQQEEITQSQRFLKEVTGAQIDSFAYPYGGFHTFTQETEHILATQGIKLSWNVEPRDITAEDIRVRPLALPRYDCNMFSYGKSNYGAEAPE